MWLSIGVVIVIAALLGWSVFRLIQRRRQGGGCAACPYANGSSCSGCADKTAKK